MESIEYLGYVDEIGRTINGDYIYRLYFTYDKDVVWGDYFNICPSSIVPNITPDINTMSHIANIYTPIKLELAKNNACFSMQDCIDGILPLAFININDEDNIENINNNGALIFRFGETIDNIVNICKKHDIFISDLEEITNNTIDDIDTIIDNLE